MSTSIKKKHSISKLKRELKQSYDEKYKTKLRAIIYLREHSDETQGKVAARFVVSRMSISTWIRRYNENGLKGLRTNKGGRPKGKTKWDDTYFKKLAKEIDKAEQYWSIPLMQEWLKEHEKVEIPEVTCWYRMTQLGYSYKSSRPYPYQGDKKKQEQFKKRASEMSWRVLSSKASRT